jgi:aldose 1-epimerase
MRTLLVLPALLALAACGSRPEATRKATMTKQPFGKSIDGVDVDLYTLTNAKGTEVAITNLGGIVVAIKVPDRAGKIADVALGFDKPEEYGKHLYFGAIIGRYGNRIGKGKFTLGGKEYTLAKNNGENSLHGGAKGFDRAVWTAKEAGTADSPALELNYLSKDGEENYPGNLNVTVTYTLTPTDELRIDYKATTDKETVVNLTNHSYFNLAGSVDGDILGHEVTINASRFTPVDAGLIPTGELKAVEGTPFDFRKPMAIGARINAEDEQIKLGRGYDHNYVLDSGGGSLALAARVVEPKSRRVMEVLTTEPGLQFYTGNFMDGSYSGKGGKVYRQRYGFCMETQHYPDSPNKPSFPSTVLKPGSEYRTTTIYRFLTQ